MEEKPPSKQIDDIIKNLGGWKGQRIARIRAVVMRADPGMVEAVKWKKPSKPEGVPVWTHGGGNVCIAEALKNAVRVTFPNGAALSDPKKLFNARLDSKSIRAIDIGENVQLDEAALGALIKEAVA